MSSNSPAQTEFKAGSCLTGDVIYNLCLSLFVILLFAAFPALTDPSGIFSMVEKESSLVPESPLMPGENFEKNDNLCCKRSYSSGEKDSLGKNQASPPPFSGNTADRCMDSTYPDKRPGIVRARSSNSPRRTIRPISSAAVECPYSDNISYRIIPEKRFSLLPPDHLKPISTIILIV